MNEEQMKGVGDVSWYMDPDHISKKEQEMSQFVDQMSEKYQHIPGIKEKLNQKFYKNLTALKLTQKEEMQNMVKDKIAGQLSVVAGKYGPGQFLDTYRDMVDVIAPNATALGGGDATRDFMQQHYNLYFRNQANAYSLYPNQRKLNMLNEALTNQDMRTILTPETIGAVTTIYGSMETALKGEDKSELAKHQAVVVAVNENRVKAGQPPMSMTEENLYLKFGSQIFDLDKDRLKNVRATEDEQARREVNGETLMTDVEMQAMRITGKLPVPRKAGDVLLPEQRQIAIMLANKFLPDGKKLSDQVMAHYTLTGEHDVEGDPEYAKRIQRMAEINKARVAEGIPAYSRKIQDHHAFTGTLRPDSATEKADETVAKLKELGADKEMEPDRWEELVRRIYTGIDTKTAKQIGEDTLKTAATIEGIDPKDMPADKRSRLAKTDPPGALVNQKINIGQDQEAKTTADRTSNLLGDTVDVADAAFRTMGELKSIKAGLGNLNFAKGKAAGGFITGAWADQRRWFGRVAELFYSYSPNPHLKNLIISFGSTPIADVIDASSKRLLLYIAKDVGRITNLSLKFAQDTVPGLMRTPEGNDLIIAVMERTAERQMAIGKLAEEHQLLGMWPEDSEGKRSIERGFYARRREYRTANPMITPHIQGLIKKATRALYGLQGKPNKKAPSMNSITVKAPKPDNPAFKKYLESNAAVFPPGTKYDRTEDGKHIYVFPNGQGAKVDIYWDDKNPQSDVTDKTPPASAPPNDKASPLTLENMGNLTIKDIANSTPEAVEKFWAENEAKIKTLVDPSIIDEIIGIVNKVRKP